MIDGLAVVDKPAGPTSHDVVARCRKIFGQRRVGHSGTLDPGATGLLLVGLGRATRLLRFLTALPKTYQAEVVFGSATTTLDDSGAETGRWDMHDLTVETVREAARSFVGEIRQLPPMVSAVKVGGNRLHRLAREGLAVERVERSVVVSRFDVFPAVEQGVFPIEVACSAGTYVRSLADDLGRALGGGAHLRRLRRQAIGSFTVADAHPLPVLAELGPAAVLSPAEALRDYACVRVNDDQQRVVGHGGALDPERCGATGGGPWAVVGPDGALLAVYERSRVQHATDRLVPAVVLAPAPAAPE